MPFQDARLIASEAEVPVVTVLAPTAYLENLSAPWSAERVVRDGGLAYPLPAEAPMAWVATADVGLAAVRAVDAAVAGWFALPGNPYTGEALAAELSEALGVALRWEQLTPSEFGERLRPHLGDHAADGTAASTSTWRRRRRRRPPIPARRAPRSGGRRGAPASGRPRSPGRSSACRTRAG